MQKKIERAQRLWLQDFSQREIAAKMGCHERTIRRYLTAEIDGETSEDLAATMIDPTLRGQFLAKAEPLMLQMVDRLQTQLDDDVIKSRDLVIALGTLFDKISRLSPPPPSEASDVEPTNFILQCSDEVVEEKVQARLREAGVIEGDYIGQDTDKNVVQGDKVDISEVIVQ